MLHRVVARLDIKGPNLIKGLQFDGHRVLGSAEQFAREYYKEGIDELFYVDTVASLYERNSLLDIIRRTASSIFIPLTVAGGVRSIGDIKAMLRAGADKVAINTAAVENPELLADASRIFGSQCIVSQLDYYRCEDNRVRVWVNYGREPTELDAFDWAKRVEDLGVGEIILCSVNRDGMGRGFDLEITSAIADSVSIPVVVSGGAGNSQHVVDGIKYANASAVAVGSAFHYHYATPINGPTLQFKESRLRMGDAIDSGNVQFLNDGYGGERAIMVDSVSIPDLKAYMNESEIRTRVHTPGSLLRSSRVLPLGREVA